ncbi:MAG: response regulator [Planctomycetes bacterium]|nr:response regulator [Planctomycetota bacterium]
MKQLKILLVDDEEDLTSTMVERLGLRDFQVEAATSGIDALKRVSEGDFDVLVLDVKMPGIGGLQVMAEIKRQHLDLPVILLTGHGSAADAERGMKEGASDYLMKPIDIDTLVEKIRNAVQS